MLDHDSISLIHVHVAEDSRSYMYMLIQLVLVGFSQALWDCTEVPDLIVMHCQGDSPFFQAGAVLPIIEPN